MPPSFGMLSPGFFWQERRCDRRWCRRWNLFIYEVGAAPLFPPRLLGVHAFDRSVVDLARSLVLAGVPLGDARTLADQYEARVSLGGR